MTKSFGIVFLTQPISNDSLQCIIELHPVHLANIHLTVNDYVEIQKVDGTILCLAQVRPRPSSTKQTIYMYKPQAITYNIKTTDKLNIVPLTHALETLETIEITPLFSAEYHPLILHQLSKNPIHPLIQPHITINNTTYNITTTVKEPSIVTKHTIITTSTSPPPTHSFYPHIIKTIELSLNQNVPNPQAHRRFFITGPSGTGKTTLLQQIIQIIQRKRILSLFCLPEASLSLTKTIEMALEHPKTTIIIIDDFDFIPSSAHQCLHKLIGTDVVVLAAGMSSPSDTVFDRVFTTEIPSAQDRFNLLKVHLPHITNTNEISLLNEHLSGYTHRDVYEICKGNPNDINALHSAIAHHPPSGLSEITLVIPHIPWTSIGGYSEIKQRLSEAVDWPLKHSQQLAKFHVQKTRGILLHGPPGNSKTLMAKALATEAKCNFVAVKGPEMLSKYVGETEGKVKEVFSKARQNAPCVVFFDEIDGLLGNKERGKVGYGDRLLSQFLVEMDGLKESNVIVLAATNRPDLIDVAMLRPGRFDRILFVDLPDFDARLAILKIYVQQIDFNHWANNFVRCSGAEIAGVCREAALVCLRDGKDSVDDDAMSKAWGKFGGPQTKDDVIQLHVKFQNQHVSQGL